MGRPEIARASEALAANAAGAAARCPGRSRAWGRGLPRVGGDIESPFTAEPSSAGLADPGGRDHEPDIVHVDELADVREEVEGGAAGARTSSASNSARRAAPRRLEAGQVVPGSGPGLLDIKDDTVVETRWYRAALPCAATRTPAEDIPCLSTPNAGAAEHRGGTAPVTSARAVPAEPRDDRSTPRRSARSGARRRHARSAAPGRHDA